MTEFGLLLPHFSDHATRERLFGFLPRIEQLGFNSVWVRDNLSFERHGFERAGRFVDPFVALSVAAGLTRRVKLGTAVTIPYRHPLVTAQLVGSLCWASGNRFEFGVGPGTPRKPFDLTGVPYADRIRRCREMVEVVRAVADGPHAAYRGEGVSFDDVTIDPAPPRDLVVWYGGGSPASIRRALRYADGLQPGLCPLIAWDRIAAQARTAAADQGRALRLGAIPLVSLADSREKAVARVADSVSSLCHFLGDYYGLPLATAEDLHGALLAGSADDLRAGLADFVARDADVVVLDARLLMDEFEDVVERLGTEVLASFRAA